MLDLFIAGFLILLVFFTVLIKSIFGGFQAMIVFVTGASFFIDVRQAIILGAIFGLTTNLTVTTVFRKHIDWKLTKKILIGAIPGVLIGASLIAFLPKTMMSKLFGLIVIIFVLNYFFKFIKTGSFSNKITFLLSFFYGFFSGLISSGNALKAIILAQENKSNEEFIATDMAAATIVNVLKIIVYAGFALLTINDFPIAIGFFIASLTAALIGKKITKKIDSKSFQKFVYLFLAIAALKMILM